MNWIYKRGTVIALATALAFGLGACGGDGDSGPTTAEHDALKEQLAAAEADRDAAQAAAAAAAAAQATAEEAQATAEAAQMAADEARMMAEAAQANAESERDAANAASAAAMAAQMAAEMDRDAAQTAQATAEAAQMAAEAAQATAQAAATAAAAAQGMAEAERAAAEAAQADAEAARDAANAMAAAAQEAADAANARADASDAEAAMKAQEAMDANAAAAAAAEAQIAAEQAQAAAEAARDQANEARDAAIAQLAEGESNAQQRVAAALQAQADAEAARDAAVAERDAANVARGAAELARDNAIMERDSAIMERDNLQGQLDTALADDQADADEISRLMGEVSDKNDEIDGLNGQIMTLNGTISDKDDEIARLTMMIGSAGDDASDDAGASLYAQLNKAKADAAMYKQMLADQEEERAHNERVARGNALSTALSTNRVGLADRSRIKTATATGDDYLLGADGNALAAGTSTRLPFASTGVTAERTSGGTVTVKVALADTADENKFADGSGTAGAQWASAMLMRSMGEGTTASDEEIVVYTDIAAPTPTAIAAEFAGTTYVTIPATRPDSDVTGGGKIMPQTAPAVGGPSLTYNEDDTFAGMYRGVDGTFSCETSGGTCVVSTDSDGMVSVTGDLQFTPDNPAALWDKQDASYVYFGWWLNKPSTASAAHMTEAFSGIVGATAAPVENAMTGKAKYVGPAVGKYAVKSFTAGVQSDAEAGHFTATATLNADFGDATAEGTISGTVDNFNTSGDANASLWKVTLESDTFGTDANFNGGTQVTFGGLTVSGAGRWQGSFYDRVGTDADDHPNTAIGTFDAHDPGGTANISGAFGAKRQ